MDQPVFSHWRASASPIAFALFGLLCASVLGGCVETGALSGAETPEVHAQLAARAAGANPNGVRVALASLSGVPEPLENQMKDAFAVQAGERNIALADPAKAAYLIRGYVTTYPAATGTTVAAVYDVFDASKKRAQRLEDDIIVKSDGVDPWSGFNSAAIDALAARSADDLAAFLTKTPEAVAVAESEAKPPPARRRTGPWPVKRLLAPPRPDRKSRPEQRRPARWRKEQRLRAASASRRSTNDKFGLVAAAAARRALDISRSGAIIAAPRAISVERPPSRAC